MWRLVILCLAISALAVGCSTELQHTSGPKVSVALSGSGRTLVAHVSSENWPICAQKVSVSLDGRKALPAVPVSSGSFDFDLHVTDGAALSVTSTCKGSPASALNNWSTVIDAH